MRIVMMATGDIAIPSFQALAASGQVVALITQPDRPVGRHMELTPPRVKVVAEQLGIPVFQPEKMREATAVEQLRAYEPDIVVVMAYGQILSQEVIDVAKIACINAHASLLPRHRGAACIQAAIEAGDDETGITIMHVVKKLDAGDIICKVSVPLRGTETAESLHDDLALLAPAALQEAIGALAAGEDTREEQDENLMTYAPKLLRAHGPVPSPCIPPCTADRIKRSRYIPLWMCSSTSANRQMPCRAWCWNPGRTVCWCPAAVAVAVLSASPPCSRAARVR